MRLALRRLAPAVFVVALGLRVTVQLATPAPRIIGDSVAYDQMARGMLDGMGYRDGAELTARRPPGYPLFVAASYAAFGRNTTGVQVTQAVLDAATCVLVLLLARRLFGEGVALGATAMMVLSASHIAAARLLMSETLATFFFTAALWATVVGLDEGSAGSAEGDAAKADPKRPVLSNRARMAVLALAGVGYGLAVLVKGTFLPYPFLAIAVAWAASRWNVRRAVGRWAILACAFALTLAPWAIRNWGVFHRFIPVATQSGQVLYSSWNPPDGRVMGVYVDDEVTRRIMTLPEAEQSAAFNKATIEYVKAHKGQIPRTLAIKLINLVVPLDWELLTDGSAKLNPSFAFALPFLAIGLFVILRRFRDWRSWVLYIVLAGALFMSVMTYGSPRLRVPLEPAAYILAALGIAQIGPIARGWPKRRALVSGLVAAYAAACVVGFFASDAIRALGRAALSRGGIW